MEWLSGDIEKNKLELEFVTIDERQFCEIEIDCTQIATEEELIQKINELELYDNYLYKVILTGYRNFEINIYNLYKYEINNKIIKIKNNTKLKLDFEKISNENTLVGIFVKELLTKIENCNDEEEKEILEKAMEIGIEALNN